MTEASEEPLRPSPENLQTEKTTKCTPDFVRLSKQITYLQDSDRAPFVSETTEYQVFKYKVYQSPEIEHGCHHSTTIQLAFPINTSTIRQGVSGVSPWLPLQPLPQLQIRTQSDSSNSKVLGGDADRDWEDATLDAIAHAFADAVTEIATKDHPLRYSWMQLLPDQRMGPPWEALYHQTIALLKEKPILQTPKSRVFKRPSELRIFPLYFLHKGTPIFDDLATEQYLAPEYGARYRFILEDLGVAYLNWTEILDRLEADLKRFDSRIKTYESNEWHTACADLLLRGMQEDDSVRQRLESMAIIPLLSVYDLSIWTEPPTDSLSKRPMTALFGGNAGIYFPNTEGIPIPILASLRLVDARAACVPSRAAFFRAMGVKDCPKQVVLDAIKKEHEGFITRGLFPSSKTDEKLNAQYRYLFHFDPDPEKLNGWLQIPIEGGIVRKGARNLFFPSDREYDVEQLLHCTGAGYANFAGEQQRVLPMSTTTFSFEASAVELWSMTLRNGGAISATNDPVVLMSKSLVDFVSINVRCHNLSWIDWLGKATGGRYFPRLVDKESPHDLSPVFLQVARQRPRSVVGLLHAHWKTEYEAVVSSASWIPSKLAELDVMCESGRISQLKQTYLPLPDLKRMTTDLGLEHEFPFLKLPVIVDSTNYQDWQFLQGLGVGIIADLQFYKLALERIRASEVKNIDFKKLANIYSHIADIAQRQNKQDQDELRDYFAHTKTIYYTPFACATFRYGGIWITSEQCVWKAPQLLSNQWPLEELYGNDVRLKNFFTGHLGVRECTIEEVLRELKAMSKPKSELFARLHYKSADLYQYLDATVQSDTGWDLIRQEFNEHNLVFTGRTWRPLSSCVWTSPVPLQGIALIDNQYPELERFFVKRLGIDYTRAPARRIRVRLPPAPDSLHPDRAMDPIRLRHPPRPVSASGGYVACPRPARRRSDGDLAQVASEVVGREEADCTTSTTFKVTIRTAHSGSIN